MKPSRPLSAQTLWQIDRIGGLALAPDGERAVCSLTSYDLARSSTSLLSTAGLKPRPQTRCGAKDGQPAWSPKGDRILFITKRDLTRLRIRRSDTRPAQARPVLDGGC